MRRRAVLAAATSAVLFPGLARGSVAGGTAYFAKMAAFDAPDRSDVFIDEADRALLDAVVARLSRVQDTVGFGNFSIIGLDETIAAARGHASVGAFPRAEIDFMERVFFDVGQRGLGHRNFTADFATTPVYRRLVALGYMRMRYPRDNLPGVRFEPWHIRVVS